VVVGVSPHLSTVVSVISFSYLTGLGFIVANLPGLMIGAYAGNRIGAIRDAKGKSVAAVFSQLGGSQKAEVRSQILWRTILTASG